MTRECCTPSLDMVRIMASKRGDKVKVATIVGARPQFIKASVVSRALRLIPGVREVLVHTGQHYDESMSEVFFRELDIPGPDYNLAVGSGPHGMQTGRMLETIERVLIKEKPDWVLVYGDTNSTLAGALAAAKQRVPVAHVEAGVRSFNRRMPEEVNRVLTDHVADLLFAPTTVAADNLRREGISERHIHLVGDVMYDVALFFGDRAERRSRILERLQLHRKQYILCTIHRAENTDCPLRLRVIFEGVTEVARQYRVAVPLHPRTRHALERHGMLAAVGKRLCTFEPVGYLDMVQLEKNATLMVTDSGGVQKEAFFYRVPCVTLRDETEWPELTELGWNRIVPPESSSAVANGIAAHLSCGEAKPGEPYGAGDAAERICRILVQDDVCNRVAA
jgi:UDP-GlcNAc3NAcA epimerase